MGEPVTAQLTQRAGEGLVPKVGTDISGSTWVKSRIGQNSQQTGQQI